jgi:hypothetical protein
MPMLSPTFRMGPAARRAMLRINVWLGFAISITLTFNSVLSLPAPRH